MILSITTSLAVAMACFMAYGVTGATLIFVLLFQLISLCIGTFKIARNQGEKSSLAVMVVFYTLMLIQQIPYMMGPELVGPQFGLFVIIIGTFLFVMFIGMAISNASDLWSYSGKKIDNGNLYMVLKRPKTLLDYIITVFGTPVSSVSFATAQHWYKYDAKNGMCLEADLNASDGYVFIDTGIAGEDISIMNRRGWSFRHNCVTGYYPITKHTYLEPRPWEWLPSVYVKRVIREAKCKVLNNCQ